MAVTLERAAFQTAERVNVWVCLSTDTKPTSATPGYKLYNGDEVYEIDTAKTYVYSSSSDTWTEKQGGGGGTDANAVHYIEDTGKTDSEKAQARTNIGAQPSTDNNLTTTAKTVTGAINELNNTKASKATLVSQAEPTAITLADNTEYTLTNVSALTFSYPTGSYACWIRLTTAVSGTVTVTFPAGTLYVPAVQTFGNSETWLIYAENNIVTAQKAVSAS